ncbi:MAG: metallophosphoesterase family protein [Verrucomicrobiales bacterium]|nr:metallophosphoesterase family protein [Verrucomicrobiales bacterium]
MSPRKLPLITLLPLLLAVAHAADDKEPQPVPTPRAPYVQFTTHDAITVVWRTADASTPVVRYGNAPGNLALQVPTRNILVRTSESKQNPLSQTAPETHQYEARITGLKPFTKYFYSVADGRTPISKNDGSYHFTTHPKPGTQHPTRFWVVGDSGRGSKDQADVHDAMLEYVAKTNRPLDLYLHVGDMAYTKGKDHEFERNFFAMYEPTLRNTPVWAAMGNHEGYSSKGKDGTGPYYDAYICPTRGEAGGTPSGTEAYYSFDYGKIHFIVLDSHDLDRKPTAAMALWLKEDLEATTADWIVAYWHHPPYTLGSHDSNKESQLVEMRKYIVPILDSGGVDVCFTGHSHIYERSMLVDGAYATPTTAEGVILDDGDGDPEGDGPYRKSAGLNPNEGTVHVVAGHGGTGLSRKGTMPIMRKIIVENGSVICDIDGDTFKGVMVNKKGETRDVFAIVKSGKVTPVRVENPWQHPTKDGEKKNASPAKVKIVEAKTPIPKNATWHYLAGSKAPDGWTWPTFDDRDWKNGRAGFGYGDDDDNTVLADMKGNYTTVYIRNTFNLASQNEASRLGLKIRYDDAFIVFLNGQEIFRQGINSKNKVTAHNATSDFDFFPLAKYKDNLLTGKNTIAIEGHNISDSSSDLTLDPYLVITK